MRFFLLWLCSIFAGIFYLFSRVSGNTSLWFSNLHGASISGNLFLESSFFLGMGAFFFWYFSATTTSPDNLEDEEKSPLFQRNTRERLGDIQSYISRYRYYLGWGFLYLLVYIFLYSASWGSFSYFILFLVFLLFFIFFLRQKLPSFRSIFTGNLLIISSIYILFYLWSFFDVSHDLRVVEFLTSLSITILYVLFLYQQGLVTGKGWKPHFLMYFFLYALVSGVFYLDRIFGSILMSYSLVSFTMGIVAFYISGYVPTLSKNKKILRYTGIVLLYSTLVSSALYTMLYGLFFIPLLILLSGSIFHYRVHYHYENYISFFVSFLHVFFLISYVFFHFLFMWEGASFLLLFNFVFIGFAMLGYSYFSILRYQYDVLALHIFAYIVNVFWVTLFLVFWEFHIFTGALIVLIELIFVFLSYYRLKRYTHD